MRHLRLGDSSKHQLLPVTREDKAGPASSETYPEFRNLCPPCPIEVFKTTTGEATAGSSFWTHSEEQLWVRE